MEEKKESIVFRIHSLLKLKFDLREYPHITSPKKWVRNTLEMLKNKTPKILNYISKQKVMAHLQEYHIIMNYHKETEREKIILGFKLWIQKEVFKRLILVIIEAILIPFSALLVVVPGPNFFFYVPAILLYFHLKSYRALRKIDVDDLDIEILLSEKGDL